jgi:hypothetical protein
MERRRRTVRQKELHEFLVEAQERRLWTAEHAIKEKWSRYEYLPEEQFQLAALINCTDGISRQD